MSAVQTPPNAASRDRGLGKIGPRCPFAGSTAVSLGALMLTIVFTLALCCAPTFAATGHRFLSSLKEARPGSPLGEPDAVAVDHASGDVFVGDPETGMMDVYNSAGAYLTQFGEGQLAAVGVAVDESTGLVYVADSFENAVLVFKPDGSGGYAPFSTWFGEHLPGEEFGAVAGIAIDNSTSASAGDVYVVDGEAPETGVGTVDVFKPKPAGPEEATEGEPVRTLTNSKMELPNGVAVSRSSGGVFVADGATGAVFEFSATGTLEGKLTGSSSPQGGFRGKDEEEGNVSAVALDETTGDLLVAEAERRVVAEFNPAGEWVGWIANTPSGAFGEPRGVAVTASGQVYVADVGLHVVDLFGAGVVVPDITTGTASKLSRTSAGLNGTINGDAKPAHYHFEWGTSEALGSSTAVMANEGSEEKVSASLAELHAGTTYYFRLSGEDENGTNVGAIRQVTTLPAVDDVSSGPVQELTPTSAILTGTLSPDGVEAHYYFEWGLTSSYTNRTPDVDAGTGSEAVAAKTMLEGLTPNTSYHYRLVAENEYGTTFGEDEEFATSGPPRLTLEAATGIGHETATIKAKIDPDELASTYRFEYGETTAYGSEVPTGGASVGSGSTPVAVSQALSSLRLGVTYHYRVVATNSAGTTTGADQTFTTIAPALIDSESVAEVTASSAKLQTQINPLGHDTTFYFQYGTASCKPNPGGCTNVPAAPGKDVGSGETDVPSSEPIQELKPGTTYYYRVLATNSLGISEGQEHTFTTEAQATPFVLPDGRTWEMVSPPDKQGAPVEALTREGGLIMAAENGNALTYVVDGAFGEEAQGNRSPEWEQVLATRGPTEWNSHDIATPNTRAKGVTAGQTPEYQYFTPDLSTALVEPAEDTPDAEPPLAPGVTQSTIYLRDDTGGTYLPLVTDANVFPGTVFGEEIHFVGASADLSHVVIASHVALTGPNSAPGLYEWADGALQLVSVLPNQSPASGLVELGYNHIQAGAISADGSQVIWTKVESEPHLGHLYMRDTVTGQTVQLDAAQGVAEPTVAGSARFETASSDGSRVFFTDRQRLTPDSTAEPLALKPDLYECEMVVEGGTLGCRLSDLTVDANAGEHANVQGLLLGTNENGTSTYFVAQGVLATNANGNGETALAGNDNLYEVHYDGAHWTTVFIAMLSNEDNAEWEGARIANSAFLTARVSPNGRYLAFMSAASLTGYDNTDQNSGKADEEVYLYDSQAHSLGCVSCNPTGARPTGVPDSEGAGEGLGLVVDRRKVWLGHWLAGNIPGWTAENLTGALIQSRYLTDDGRLYFNSPDSLVPQASNQKEDVYEYEPSGVGSCESASGGCVALISSGSSGKESAFLEATPDGSNVFFITAAQLLPQDTDTAFDIYDARECSGASPCQSPSAAQPPPCATTNACRAAAAPQQAPVGPSGSAAISGQGNIAPAAAKPPSKPVKTSSKPITRAQKLAKALKSCRKQHSKRRRKACEQHARKLYGAKAASKAKAKRSSSGRSRKGGSRR